MVTQVLRHKCDICGQTHMLHSTAMGCEKMCVENALAAAASGGDVKQAPGEAPQSGPKGNAQNISGK